MSKILSLKDSYNVYCQYSISPISKERYLRINEAFMNFMIEKIYEGHKIWLPHNMGNLQCVGRKQKPRVLEDGGIRGLAPDWKATKEYREANPGSNKVIFHMNNDTDNVRYKIKWSKYCITTLNKSYYFFRNTRTIKRTIASYIKNKTYEYEVL